MAVRIAMCLVAAAGLVPVAAAADPVRVAPGGLAAALAAAPPGATLQLAAGVHGGPVVVSRPLALQGAPGAVVDGGGTGSVITVDAPDVTVSGLEVRNSGTDLSAQDSGIFVGKAGTRARIAGNRLSGNLIGVYLWGAADAVVAGNVIAGRDDLRMNERGNGVQVWNAPGAAVTGNDISRGRDGIFVNASRRNVFRGNRLADLRFAIHYMYGDDGVLENNVSSGNHAGFALMYSRRLSVRGNRSAGDRDHGLLLNYANSSVIENNAVTAGGGKCVFIYNSNGNAFRGNRFEGCGIGVHFTAGSERNTLAGNAFIGNRTQVKYVGTRWLDWTENGRGNYWSDNPAFDLDGDGLADRPWRPNGIVDQLLWRYPAARLLLNSPAVTVLRWAQARFPGLHPGGVIDTAPLMRVSAEAG